MLSLLVGGNAEAIYNLAQLLGFISVILLFLARFLLYRQRQFLAVGPRALNRIYRKVYYAAYVFIILSVLLFVHKIGSER